MAVVAAAAMAAHVARRLRRQRRRWRRRGAAPPTLTMALDSDAAASGYDPLLYSQGQFTFFSSMYDALFVTDTDGKVAPSLVDRIREQRRQHRN